MHSVLRLQVHLRVPVRVEDDDRVCCLEVQPQSPSPCAEQEDVKLTVGLVEQLHPFLSILGLSRSIEPKMANSGVLEVGLHDVHQVSHLREDEHAMPKPLEFGEEAVDELELA